MGGMHYYGEGNRSWQIGRKEGRVIKSTRVTRKLKMCGNSWSYTNKGPHLQVRVSTLFDG